VAVPTPSFRKVSYKMMNVFPMDRPLPISVTTWVTVVINEMIRDGRLVVGEPTNDTQLKICGTGRDAITGLPVVVCRTRLADGPVIKMLAFDPVPRDFYQAVFSLDQFRSLCPDSYRDCEAAILGSSPAKTLHQM
jgi:hypothetical protein